MADSIGRGSSRGRRARGNSWSSSMSVRNPPMVDDASCSSFFVPPAPGYQHHSLRAVDSRFSLSSQFAATRSVYEFGFDDGGSVLERGAAASTVGQHGSEEEEAELRRGGGGGGGDDDDEKTKKKSDQPDQPGPSSAVDPAQELIARLLTRTHYELLCLPRTSSLESPEIRRAYLRLVQLLHAGSQPRRLRNVADAYFDDVQVAFETLVEPHRRVSYDVALRSGGKGDRHDGLRGDTIGAREAAARASDEDYEEILRRALLIRRRQEARPTFDLAVRLDGSDVLQRKWHGDAVRPVDFSLSQSLTVGIPALGRLVERRARAVQDLVHRSSVSKTHPVLRCSKTFLTINGSAYGVMADMPMLPDGMLSDRYQPLLPESLPRRRMHQILQSRVSPLVSTTVRQEFVWAADARTRAPLPPNTASLPDAVVEVESDLLPQPTLTLRLAHPLHLARLRGAPIHFEASVTSPDNWRPAPPRVGLAAHQRIKAGTIFACIDSGDWFSRSTEEVSRLFDLSSQAGLESLVLEIPLITSPTVEIGFHSGPRELGLRAGQALTEPAGRGIRGLDHEMDGDDRGSWTVSTAATAGSVAGYMRYGRDLFSSTESSAVEVLGPTCAPLMPSTACGLRMEVELCAQDFSSYGCVALRSLRRVGRFSKLGVEVGISTSNLHVSIYWSRLGQRISVPVLVAGRASFNTDLLFIAALTPFAGFAVAEFLLSSSSPLRRRQRRGGRGIAAGEGRRGGRPASSVSDLSKEQLQRYIARKRAEADDLTAVLAGGVEARQAAERQRDGLVILSAKYGVRDDEGDGRSWSSSEEVADVTVAVAALVNGAELLIPRGLRKSHILGFWDPAPLRTKVLCVRYLYEGHEHFAEVRGREELRLP